MGYFKRYLYTNQPEEREYSKDKFQWILTVICLLWKAGREENHYWFRYLCKTLYTQPVWSRILGICCSFFDTWLVTLARQTKMILRRYIVLFCMSSTFFFFLSCIRRANYECLNRVRGKKNKLTAKCKRLGIQDQGLLKSRKMVANLFIARMCLVYSSS